jgi:hypothetical protein
MEVVFEYSLILASSNAVTGSDSVQFLQGVINGCLSQESRIMRTKRIICMQALNIFLFVTPVFI